jgi:nitroimidazol reductase NimA-like FMN-containing flavoprotein (pyridoxamine 5'-phosphate oxidase superfamily)
MSQPKDRRLTMSGEVAQYLEEMRIPLRLAAVTESGWPLVLSLWYVLDDAKLWCATQDTAKIVRYLEADSRCAFEVASERPPYRGVRGQGRARLSSERGKEVLETLLDRYLSGRESPLAQRLLAKADTETAIEITPTTLFTWDYTSRMRRSVPS